ncbi:Linear gramicidin synthase subunit D [Pseudoalteromonas holothuriae]|uniref:Linear gramicidin synthase subunit D n=1 Tax=Pseudoalteromonas holothuriae TaxID=2963714 RepID=A0A9W4QTD4_9GAMM|nr:MULTISPECIES: non-ribosomal peptide synthetase [unclassified Pseudoalteromonas]CAH9050273.1 Linear gramicidin synthase subunit D [Pseudoalteromonas sp. CIP111951]CAH9052394.1 Linear gramicidin synthase subunit D [Pseudoalteromonas sp. CIP111854]
MKKQIKPFKLEKQNIESFYPLSPMQHVMVSKSLQAHGEGLYHIQVGYEIKGELDKNAFQNAWLDVIKRHDTLRTCFSRFDSAKPMQVVCKEIPLPWVEFDLTDNANPEHAYENWLAEDRSLGFDIERPGLMRLLLFVMSAGNYRFVWSHHHAISDGWSVPIVINDVLQAYQARVQKHVPGFAPTVSFKAMINWLAQQDVVESEQYWQHYLSGLEGITELKHYGYQRDISSDKSKQAQHRDFYLSHKLTAQSEQFAQRCGVTTNVLYSAVFGLLLTRYTARDDVIYGNVTSGRNVDIAFVENMVGPCVNTVPVRYQYQHTDTVMQWLQKCFTEQGIRNKHDFVSLLKISKLLPSDKAGELFNCLYVFENYPKTTELNQVSENGATKNAVNFTPLASEEANSFPFSFIVAPGEETQVRISSSRDKFGMDFIEQFFGDFIHLLTQVIVSEQQQLSLIGLSDEQSLSSELQASEQQFTHLAQACEHWANVAAQKVALVTPQQSITYGQLHTYSTYFAEHLLHLGVNRGDKVAIYLSEGYEQVITMLAVLKLGACYVPIDVNSPTARSQYIAKDANVACVVASKKPAWWTDPKSFLPFTLEPAEKIATLPAVSGEDIAYVIYTSGTTGKPKGVMITQQQVIRLFSATEHGFTFTDRDKWLLLHSFAFDFSVWEIWGAWLYGAQLYIPPTGVERDFERLFDYLYENEITVLNQTPSAFYQLAQVATDRDQQLDKLHSIIFGGEKLSPALLRGWAARYPLEQVALVNMYGITEITVHGTYYKLTSQDLILGDSCIGLPLADLTILVLDQSGNAVPRGCAGEIWVLGAGVSQGYLNREALTSQKFTTLLGMPAYRSGDLGYVNEQGRLVYIGRADKQIQLRGYRIELGEVEQALHSIDGVEQAAVIVAGQDDNSTLIAFVVDAHNRATDHFVSQLRALLPAYMLPGRIHLLDALPRTMNGKVNTQSLKQLDEDVLNAASASDILTPRENEIALIWSQLLGRPVSSKHANFFELGGHSLMATQFVFAYKKAYKAELPAQLVFEYPVLEELAKQIECMADIQEQLIPTVNRASLVPLSYSQQRLWFLSQLEGGEASYNLPLAMEIRGPLMLDALKLALKDLVVRHTILRTKFVNNAGHPAQTILENVNLPIAYFDVAHWSEQQLQDTLNSECRRAFSFNDDLLIRATIYEQNPQQHILMLVLHHIITDGWSNGILQRDLISLYRVRATTETLVLPDLPIQYIDFAAWQRGKKQDFTEQLKYWQQKLANMNAVMPMPLDGERADAQHTGANLMTSLSKEQVKRLETLAANHDVTTFMVLLSAFQAVLSHYCGNDDIALGTVVANRPHSDLENVVGFFTNTLVVRDRVDRQQSFLHALMHTKTTLLDAYKNQDVPFEQVVEHVCPKRPEYASPLVQVMFVLQNAQQVQFNDESVEGLEISPVPWDYGQSKFDLTVSLQSDASGMQIHFEYKSDLFSQTRMQRWLTAYGALLENLLESPQIPLEQLLSMHSDSEDFQQHETIDWEQVSVMTDEQLQDYIDTLPEDAMQQLLERLEE